MGKNFKIGAGIALDGEKEFKNAVSNINKDIRVLASEMGKVTAEFSDNAKSVEALTAKQDVLNRQLLNQTDKVETLKAALKDSAQKYGENDAKTKDWQISLNKAEAELSKTKSELDQTSKQLDEFGDESKQSGDQVEKAGKQAKESGDDAKKGGDGWEKLGHGLSKIGGMAATAVKGLTAASIAGAAAIGAMTIKAGEAADEINTLNKITGLSTDTLQKFKFASERVDVSMETLTGAMAKLTKNMGQAQAGSKKQEEAFKKLGVAFKDNNGNLRDSEDVFNDVITALGGVSNEAERDVMAMDLFGKSAQELNPLILGGADAFKLMGEEAEKAGLILSQEQLDKLNAVDDAVQGLKSTMQGVGMQFAAEFAGPISEGINQVTGFVKELLDAYKAGGMDALAKKTGEVLGDVINQFGKNLPGILDATMEVINGILESVIENIPEMTAAGVEFFVSLISNASEIISKIAYALPEVIQGIIDALLADDGENLKMIIQSGVELFAALVENTAKIIEIIADALPEIIDGITETLTSPENLGKMEDAGASLARSVAKGFYAIGRIIFPQMFEQIDKLRDFKSGLEAIRGAASGSAQLAQNFRAIDGRASGGPVMGGAPYIVGELGPELFVPNVGGDIVPNSATGTVVSNVYMDSVLVASASGKAQYMKNSSRARSYGVVPA